MANSQEISFVLMPHEHREQSFEFKDVDGKFSKVTITITIDPIDVKVDGEHGIIMH